MRISRKLTLGSMSMALLVGAVGNVGYFQMGNISQDIDEIVAFETPAAFKLADMQTTLLEGVGEAFVYPLLNEPHGKVEFFERIAEFDRQGWRHFILQRGRSIAVE